MAPNRSVENVLRVLELISKNPEGITLAEIYKELKMAKATAYDILQTLYKEDAIYYKEPALKNYVIGSKIFAIGQAYTKNSNFINFASSSLNGFANKYHVTVFASKRIGNKVTHIYKYESPKTRIITPDVGVQMPLYTSIVGKAFLAFLSDEKRESLLAEIKQKEFKGIETIEFVRLVHDLKKYQEQGFVFDNGESENYMKQIAVPVYNFENMVTGVISSTELNGHDNTLHNSEKIAELLKIADYVSEKQGFKKQATIRTELKTVNSY